MVEESNHKSSFAMLSSLKCNLSLRRDMVCYECTLEDVLIILLFFDIQSQYLMSST